MDKHLVYIKRLQKNKIRMLMDEDLKDYRESCQEKLDSSTICLRGVDVVTSFLTQMSSIKALGMTVTFSIVLYLLWALFSTFFDSR